MEVGEVLFRVTRGNDHLPFVFLIGCYDGAYKILLVDYLVLVFFSSEYIEQSVSYY